MKLWGNILDDNARLKRVSDFAPSIAHDIKNMLSVVNGYVDLLELENVSSKNSIEYISNIRSEIIRISDLTQDVLDMTSEKLNVRKELIAFDSFLSEIENAAKLMKGEKDIELVFNFQHSLEVVGDRDRLYRAFMNLIKNSVDAIDRKGKIFIKAKSVGHELSFMIYDTGKGIAKQSIANIFDLYFTSKTSGTGLGLSIAKEIISAHGGMISCRSALGRYTCFVIRLKLYE